MKRASVGLVALALLLAAAAPAAADGIGKVRTAIEQYLIDKGIIDAAGTYSGVSSTRSIATTAPLAGGGDLSANRTLTFTSQTANKVLASATSGGSTVPDFRTLVAADIPSLAASKITSGQLATAQGGTGIDTSAVTNGQLLIGNTTGNVWARATLTGTSNQVVVTNAASSITLSLPQSIATSSTPTFASLALSSGTVYAGAISWGAQQANAQNSSALIGPSSGNFNITLGDANSDFEVHSGVGDVTYTEGLFRMSGKTDGLSILLNAGSLTGPYGAEIILNGGNGTTGGSFTVYTSPATSTFPARFYIDNLGNVVLNKSGSALATSTTDGFTYLPTCAGTPTGTPTAFTGAAPLVVDSTNNILYFRSGGSWVKAGPVTSITGTTNQVVASASTGDITLSLPQSIATSSTPTFASLTLSSGLTLTGATVTGAPIWSSNQAITLSTANQPNVTGLGTIVTGTWSATAIAATVGGTGQTSYAVGDLLYAPTTTTVGKLADVATGQVLTSGGVNTAPAYSSAPTLSSLSLSATSNQLVLHSASNAGTLTWVPTTARTLTLPDVTSTVMTTGGGQTVTSGTWNGTAIATTYGGTGIDTSGVTNGQLLIGNTTGNVWARATLTGTSNQVVVTNAASSITLSLPQSIATSSSPTFTGLGLSGKVTSYNLVTTAGNGIMAIVASGRSTAQTAAVTTVTNYLVPGADATYSIMTNLNVTTSTTFSINVQVTYFDESNNSQTVTLNFQNTGGTILSAITQVQGAGPYEGVPITIRVKASTTITVKTVGTFTSVTYNVEGHIVQIA